MNILKSPISRVGGKAYLSEWLCSFIPEHTTYVEPFAGGAKLLFAKNQSQIEILNDQDDNIVNLYRVIQNDEKRQRLIKLLNETPYSRSIFQSWKYGDEMTLDDIEKARRYFFLCKASFAGDVERGGFGVPSKGTGRNPAQSYYNAIDSLNDLARRLKGVTVECLDYQDCISRYDSEDTLFFCDPPYWNAEHYYGNAFTEQDHYTLAGMLHNIKGKAVKTKLGDLTLNPGQVITLADEKATKLITEGKIKPINEPKQQPEPQITGYELAERMAIMGENCDHGQTEPFITSSGILVIPFNSDKKYHYWNDGISVCNILQELGRCDLIDKYKSFYSN